MASESSTERTVSLTLPPEVDDWLDEQAATADLDPEEFLIQLLSAYQQTTAADGTVDSDLLTVDQNEISRTVEAELTEQLSGVLDDRIEAAVTDELTDQVTEATNSLQRRLSNRIDTVEEEFDGKINDVRERVIQVKKETDQKAPKDHSHDELDRVEELETQIADIESELEAVRSEFEELVPDHEEKIGEIDGRVSQMQDRLQTVAWVVSDLREAHESGGGLQAVERIKRAAAKADIERAKCENCGEGVTLSLLTDPECPHCNATVSNVEPAGGWFGKPKLLTASQLESGEE